MGACGDVLMASGRGAWLPFLTFMGWKDETTQTAKASAARQLQGRTNQRQTCRNQTAGTAARLHHKTGFLDGSI